MAIKRREANIDVVSAAEQRVVNIFSNGVPVYMSFSGGKDSLALAQIVLSLVNSGKIDASMLTVQFIDEEAIFPCIEQTVLEWRKKFLYAGAKFEWFCVEVRHFNCFNTLSEEETFICWDREREADWIRRPPPFAIRSHPILKPRQENYQSFLTRLCADGITIVGMRAAESLQRLQCIARISAGAGRITSRRQAFPIYDWTNNDVWLFLKNEGVRIPGIYLYLWQSGTRKGQLRVSQFFSVDTARSLVKMNEYYHDLMERIIRREPNAYLAALYWDSEMFGRSSKLRRELEGDGTGKDYRAMVLKLFANFDANFPTKHQKMVAEKYRNFFIQASSIVEQRDCKLIYEGLIRGDPKLRTLRAMYTRVYGQYAQDAMAERKGGPING